ncbi:MAG: hypothetical protein QOD98_3277 [Nocardioidaceae bacterium]|jgi:hypothetical protein|nr:hypothetical protein [Nocardioidaceae bacterium]
MPDLKGAAVALLATFALLSSAQPSLGAAAAASENTRDPSHDVLSGPYFSDDLPTRPEPDRRVGDIIRTKVTFGPDLVVTTTFRNLASVGHQEFTWFIATSEDEFPWNAALTVQPGKDRGTFSLIDPIANQPGCGKAGLDRAARTVTLTVPALCLGDPAWVRIANGVMVFVGNSRVYYDDARRDAGVRHGWKFGPKVTAG